MVRTVTVKTLATTAKPMIHTAPVGYPKPSNPKP